MRAAFFAAAAVLSCALSCGAAVRERPQNSFSASAEWEICGSVLLSAEGAQNVVYVPLRRGNAEGGDTGAVEKDTVSADGTLTRLWLSRAASPRRVLLPPCDGGGFRAGGLVELDARDESARAASGAGPEEWAGFCGRVSAREQGAPYPAAMTLVGGVLFVQGDDGLVSAIDARTGGELWAFLPPHFLSAEFVVRLARAGAPPWLAAGALTAETVEAGGDARVYLWGTLGEGAGGMYCLDVTDVSAPKLVWSCDDTRGVYIGPGDTAAPLGRVRSAPVAAPAGSRQILIVPSGEGAESALLGLDPGSGQVLRQTSAPYTIARTPLATQSRIGELTRLTACDAGGGVTEFTADDDFFAVSTRLDLRRTCGVPSLELTFSPLPCRLPRERWLAFIAESESGTLVAACPAPLKERSWSEAPWRGGDWGWYHEYSGFGPVVSALFYDGVLYLLGMERGVTVVKAIDLNAGRLLSTREAPGARALVPAERAVAALSSGGAGLSAARVTAAGAASASILYTIYR